MVLNLVIRPEHYQKGSVTSTSKDPIALAIRERLDTDPNIHFACSVLPDEILLFCQGSGYSCKFDSEEFHSRWQNIQRHLTLKFKKDG